MAAQNTIPRSTSAVMRTPRPRWPLRARARKVCHLGISSRCVCRNTPAGTNGATTSTSGIQHPEQLAHGAIACQLEEDVLEPAGAGHGVGAQLVHRAAGADLPFLDDADAVAQRLGDFERVRGH